MREDIDKSVDEAKTNAMTEAGLATEMPGIEMQTKADLVTEGMVEIVPIAVKKVKQCIVIGDKYIYSRVFTN